MTVAFSKQGDYFASGGQDQQVYIEKIIFKKKVFFFLLKVLLWKTNFDINPLSVDSNNNKYANSSDYSTITKISSGNLQQNKSQITSLKEKSQSETNDERRERKVILMKSMLDNYLIYLDRCF